MGPQQLFSINYRGVYQLDHGNAVSLLTRQKLSNEHKFEHFERLSVNSGPVSATITQG